MYMGLIVSAERLPITGIMVSVRVDRNVFLVLGVHGSGFWGSGFRIFQPPDKNKGDLLAGPPPTL